MQCPICNVALTMADRQGIEIDYCPKCRGVWFDRGELDKIIGRAANDAPVERTAAPAQRDRYSSTGTAIIVATTITPMGTSRSTASASRCCPSCSISEG